MNPDPTSLDRLHDIVTPPPVPWWPLAWGWIVVAIFLLLMLGALCLHAYLRWQANCYRREAVGELDRLTKEPRNEVSVPAMAVLLKRAAMTAYPREEVASLSGPAWFSFLDRTGSTTGFTSGAGEWLEKIAYDPRTAASLQTEELREIERNVRHWLIHHRCDLVGEGDAC